MAKIRQSNLDNSIVTGLGELTSVTSGDQTIIYDASTGTLKKISQTNFINFPNISSVSPTSATSGDGTGNYTFTITGSGFTGASATLVNTSGTTVNFDTVTVDSDTQITGVIAKSSLPGSGEPYDVKVTAATGLISTLEDQINIDQTPTYVTASGSLGSQVVSTAGSFSVNATDPESAGNVTFELQSGSLPPGYSITNTAAEGGTAIISGTDSTTSSTTTFNFVLRAVDAASNTSSRSFSILSRVPTSESFTSSGTFSVPSGITSADVLIVAGGGSGATTTATGGVTGGGAGGGGGGGLLFMPAYPVTPGGTITVTVGCGGVHPNSSSTNGVSGQDSVFGSPGDPGFSPTSSVLTAKGGGGGGRGINGGGCAGQPGGSAGGGGNNNPGGCATQPTQPGNSGSYGFGNPGGRGGPGAPAYPNNSGGGGGGGAGAAGTNNHPCGPNQGSPGGIGRAYTIADGTTSVYYAGGGGAGGQGAMSYGGLGGGGGTNPACNPGDPTSGHLEFPAIGAPYPSPNQEAMDGDPNTGGGGAGMNDNSGPDSGNAGDGGKGIVIVRY